MESSELKQYVDAAREAAPLDRYIPRKFTAAVESGEVPLEEFRFRGVFREREPGLAELLTHPRVLVLAEPGGGKSIIAKAAVHETVKAGRIPIFLELKEYRGDLSALVRRAAPDCIRQEQAAKRVYILDGIDEIPTEVLPTFAEQLDTLLVADPDASGLATARQAFYVASRSLLPTFPAVFHVLEFSDGDIRQYAKKSGIDVVAFLQAADRVDVHDELPNPFILSILVERFRETGDLSDRRSEAVSFMIDRLIRSRPRINAHRQRRALCMLAVAFEVYSRNELAEDEALQVFQTSRSGASFALSTVASSLAVRTIPGPPACRAFVPFVFHPILLFSNEARASCQTPRGRTSGFTYILVASTQNWKIVFFHHPLYSSGDRHGSDLRLREVLEPLSSNTRS